MALKNTQRNGPLKNSKKKKGYISILKKSTGKVSSNQIFVFKKQSLIPSKKLPFKKKDFLCWSKFFLYKKF
jgi:hypothetical protein